MLLSSVIFITPSCVPDDDGWFGNCTNGEGPEVERVLNMLDFTGVKLSCEAKVFITQGDVFEVVAKGEENVIDQLELDVQDDTWNIEFDVDDLGGILSKNAISGKLLGIDISQRGKSGRVLELIVKTSLENVTVSGEYKIRLLFGGLLSSLFEMEFVREGEAVSKLVIRGKGYGHGVGLCQMGAIGRAEAGLGFKEILQAYYPGTHISPILNSLE